LSLAPEALRLLEAGISVLPIKSGTKKPELETWKPFQSERMDAVLVPKFWYNGQQIALIGGKVSGGLECIDFDIPGKAEGKPRSTPPAFKPFRALLKDHGYEELYEKLFKESTPSGGVHLIYRCATTSGNTVLARNESGQTLIETRGEGGYFVAAPSNGYNVKDGDLAALPTITPEERSFLFTVCRFLNEYFPEPTRAPERTNAMGCQRAGDAYNLKGPHLLETLQAKGWQVFGKSGNRIGITRPGKRVRDGVSATITGDGQCLYVFSSNAAPFEPETSYSKFAVHALLECGGDFGMAARMLGEQGYGERVRQAVNTPTPAAAPTARKLKIRTFTEETFTPADLDFLWEPYLPKGKMVLLDADGGTGKTSVAAAIAAGLSNGILPNGEGRCEPVTTLYLHAGEDMDEEIMTIYRANGGRFNRIHFISESFPFDKVGLAALEQAIIDTGAKLVIIDALFYFLQGTAESTNSNFDVLPAMQGLNAIYQRTGACGIHIRHTRKGAIGTQASELGMGTVQFRNSHRGQLVARYHPEERGLIIVTDEKGSLLAPRGATFAYRREGHEIQYVPDFDNPYGGPAPDGTLGLKQWLVKTVPVGGYVKSRDLEYKARAAGYKVGNGQWNRAKKAVLNAEQFSDGWYVSLRVDAPGMEENDPYFRP